MSTQFDFVAGLDLSALTSATQAQIMQAINQLTALSNIGGIIWQAGTSLNTTIAQGTGGSPSVTDNPRFARYIWLNTFNAASAAPTPYNYDASTGNWTLQTVAALSITNAQIATAAAIAVTKLANGTARFILRTNAAGTAVEYVNPNSIFTNDDVPLTAIDDTAAAGTESFLRRVAGTIIWKTFAETVTEIQAAMTSLAPGVIAPGSNNTLLGTNSTGVVNFYAPDNVLANLAINISKLAQSGATAKQVIRWNGSSWVPVTPAFLDRMAPYVMTATELINGAAAAAGSIPATGNNATYRYAHGLGGVPTYVRVALTMSAAGPLGGYVSGDEIDHNAISTVTNANPGIYLYYDATFIQVMIFGNDGGLKSRQKDTPGTLYTLSTAVTDAPFWLVKIYAAL